MPSVAATVLCTVCNITYAATPTFHGQQRPFVKVVQWHSRQQIPWLPDVKIGASRLRSKWRAHAYCTPKTFFFFFRQRSHIHNDWVDCCCTFLAYIQNIRQFTHVQSACVGVTHCRSGSEPNLLRTTLFYCNARTLFSSWEKTFGKLKKKITADVNHCSWDLRTNKRIELLP